MGLFGKSRKPKEGLRLSICLADGVSVKLQYANHRQVD